MLAILKAVLVGTGGTAYGTKPAAGWTNPFNSGTNIGVFKQGAGGNNRFFRVWDGESADNSWGYRCMAIRGYESMTAISTGTGAFPTTTQVPGNGMYTPYRNASGYDAGLGAGPISPKWKIWADAQTVVMAFNGSGDPTGTWNWTTFGQFTSYKSADLFNDMVCGQLATSYMGYYGTYGDMSGMYVTRDVAGTGSSAFALPVMPAGVQSTSSGQIGSNNSPYPDPATASILLSRIAIATHTTSAANLAKPRGHLRFLWDSLHDNRTLFPPQTTFSGSGPNAGKTFEVIVPGYGGVPIVETSDTWS